MIMLHMIQASTTYTCRRCNSININKNGTNKCGNARYHCKDCGAYLVLTPKSGYRQQQKSTFLAGYPERLSLLGAQRVSQVWRQTSLKSLLVSVEHLPAFPHILFSAYAADVLDFDEIW